MSEKGAGTGGFLRLPHSRFVPLWGHWHNKVTFDCMHAQARASNPRHTEWRVTQPLRKCSGPGRSSTQQGRQKNFPSNYFRNIFPKVLLPQAAIQITPPQRSPSSSPMQPLALVPSSAPSFSLSQLLTAANVQLYPVLCSSQQRQNFFPHSDMGCVCVCAYVAWL